MNLLSILLQADAAAGEGGGGLFGNSMTSMIVMMVLLFGIMYFFMIRPQQKKQKAIQEARNSMKVGDKVVTAGGIHGRIKEVGDTHFIVEIADGVRIKVEKGSVYASASDTEQK